MVLSVLFEERVNYHLLKRFVIVFNLMGVAPIVTHTFIIYTSDYSAVLWSHLGNDNKQVLFARRNIGNNLLGS